MATNMRTALAGAVVTTLAAAFPSIPVQRGRRAPVSEAERPLILVETADAVPDDTVSIGETFWALTFSVTAYIITSRLAGQTGAQADAAAEDALGDMESRLIAALHAKDLTAPSGDPLTCGLEPQGSQIDITDAESAARRLGQVSVDFRAQLVLPVGTTTFP